MPETLTRMRSGRRASASSMARHHGSILTSRVTTDKAMDEQRDREEPVLGADGRFHATDEPVRLSAYAWEDWVVLAVFWVLALVVFHQVFTRYVLNDAAGWTEEIARYLLVAVTFLGAALAVRRNSHIRVDF